MRGLDPARESRYDDGGGAFGGFIGVRSARRTWHVMRCGRLRGAHSASSSLSCDSDQPAQAAYDAIRVCQPSAFALSFF